MNQPERPGPPHADRRRTGEPKKGRGLKAP